MGTEPVFTVIEFTHAALYALPTPPHDKKGYYKDTVEPALELITTSGGSKGFYYKSVGNLMTKRQIVGKFPVMSVEAARQAVASKLNSAAVTAPDWKEKTENKKAPSAPVHAVAAVPAEGSFVVDMPEGNSILVALHAPRKSMYLGEAQGYARTERINGSFLWHIASKGELSAIFKSASKERLAGIIDFNEPVKTCDFKDSKKMDVYEQNLSTGEISTGSAYKKGQFIFVRNNPA